MKEKSGACPDFSLDYDKSRSDLESELSLDYDKSQGDSVAHVLPK